MIEFQNVSKHYDDLKALDQFSLTINDGEIFGLIGHNGAGKSTAIKSLLTIVTPEEGSIFVDNLNLANHSTEVKKKIGYVSDTPDRFLSMTPMELWSFLGKVYEVEDPVIQQRISVLSNLLQLETIHSPMEELSHGMRQKAFIIGALLPLPLIWILDEPLTGLDPQSSFQLKEMMKEHARKGNIVLFSTHVLEVAEKLCDRIGILQKGKLVFVGTMEELKAAHDNKPLETIYLEIVSAFERGETR